MNNEKLSYDTTGRFTMVTFNFIENAKELSLHARWLYVALMYYRNVKSGKSFPSYDTIRTLTGLRREKISSSIKELESKGWITRKKRYNGSTIYYISPQRFVMQENGSEDDFIQDSSNEFMDEGLEP